MICRILLALALLGCSVAHAAPSNAQVLSQIGGTYARTAAEISAAVTPTNYGYPPGNVLRYGCDPSGVADSSTCFTNAVNSNTSVTVLPPNTSQKYIVHDVTIPSGVTVSAYGAYFVDKAGAAYVFKLTGFNTQLLGAYISSATNCSTAAIVVDDGSKEVLRDIRIINATTGVKMQSTSGGGNGFGNTKATLDNVQIDNFSGTGFYIGPNVHDGSFTNLYADANTSNGSGGYIPKTGAIGFQLVGTGSTVAYGGNQFANVLAINAQTGFQFTDANLDNFTNATADNCSGAAFAFGGSTSKMMLSNIFSGVCAIGLYSNGTGGSNRISGLMTNSTGVIPSGGGSDFYSAGGFGSFYDIQTTTSNGYFTVDPNTWQAFGTNAHTFAESTVGTIQFTGGVYLPINSNGTVAAGSTVFLGNNGQNATENNVIWQSPADQYLVANGARVILQTGNAPGAGQTFTYTLRVNGSSSALVCTSTGASTFNATCTGGPISIVPGSQFDIQLVTSAGAAATRHRGYLLALPQPN